MLILLLWAVFGIVGYFLGEFKGRPSEGLVLGLLLGPIGWLYVGLGRDYRKKGEAHAVVRSEASRTGKNARGLAVQKLRVAKDGADIGELDVPAVKLQIKTGSLTSLDYYYDESAGDWRPLGACPLLNNYWHNAPRQSA